MEGPLKKAHFYYRSIKQLGHQMLFKYLIGQTLLVIGIKIWGFFLIKEYSATPLKFVP
jgi:uncharacterized membrane protein